MRPEPDNGGVARCLARSARTCGAGLLGALLILVGCEAGVNQALIETPTPYPIRSPVVGSPSAPPAIAAGPDLATAAAAARSGAFGTAEAAFGRVLASDPDDVAAREGRAAARAASGDLDGAATDLDAALARDPSRADLYLRRGTLGIRRARFGAARTDLDRAIAIEPGNAAAFLARAELWRWTAQGDPARYQAALDDLRRASALTPDDPAARIGRARVWLDRAMFRGDPIDLDRALAELDALASGGGEAAALVRARTVAAQGRGADATQILDAPVVRAATDAPVAAADRSSARAAVLLAEGNPPAAAEAAAAAIEADPGRWDAYRTLAEAQLAGGDAVAALATADRLLTFWSDDGPGLMLRAVALARLGRTADAASAFDAARRRLAESPVYTARIAQAQRGEGRLPRVGTPPTDGAG